jgi:hypothetical protein
MARKGDWTVARGMRSLRQLLRGMECIMALPLVPIVLGISGAALAGWAAVRRSTPARIDQRAEDALDDLPEGLATRKPGDHREQTNATARMVRRITLPGGRRIEIDAGLIARLRIKRF